MWFFRRRFGNIFDAVETLKRTDDAPMRIAFCVTGQLARLELLSKIANVFIPNAQVGHTVHLYMLLDNRPEVHQTFWRNDYSKTPYVDFSERKMESFIAQTVYSAKLGDQFVSHVRLESPSQDIFEVIDEFIPVLDKEINTDAQITKDDIGVNKKMFESGSIRFQNNLQWMGGVRDCVKWVQDREMEQRLFYDIIVRLREDTLVFDKWMFDRKKVKGFLTSADLGSYNGINDHNLVVDRKWADTLFRGMIEDYYFNRTSRHQMWNNTEHHIYQIASDYSVEIQTASMCDMPLVPLRSKFISTHWLLHPQNAQYFIYCCMGNYEGEIGCTCSNDTQWLNLFDSGVSPVNWPEIN